MTNAEQIFAEFEHAKDRRAIDMPTEKDALEVMQRAWLRLKDLGWAEATYCPKDGSIFLAIEAGSTGTHMCSYMGDWPKGVWWIHDANDLYPSRPILWRARPSTGTQKILDKTFKESSIHAGLRGVKGTVC